MENTEWNVSHYSISNIFYKGDLDNLELWNKGEICFYKYNNIDLFTKDGIFYKTLSEKELKNEISEVKIKKEQSEIIQIDYNFYLIPVSERHSLQDGRYRTISLLEKLGIKGFENTWQTPYFEKYSNTIRKRVYEVSRPLEICFNKEHRYNTKSFINFDYKKYIKNYNNALIKYPERKDTLFYLKEINLDMICGFYCIDRKLLENNRFNRLTHAIKILNNKINNK